MTPERLAEIRQHCLDRVKRGEPPDFATDLLSLIDSQRTREKVARELFGTAQEFFECVPNADVPGDPLYILHHQIDLWLNPESGPTPPAREGE